MSKRPPPPNLSALTLAPTPVEPVAAPAPVAIASKDNRTSKGRLATTLYLHPEGHRALKVRAFETQTTMLDLIHEALEQWATGKGITANFRPEKE